MNQTSFLALQDNFKNSLRKAFEHSDIDRLKIEYDKLKGNDVDKKAALDQSFRDVLLSEFIGDSKIEDFIGFSIIACRTDLTTSTIPVVLLGDIFDALTLDKCEMLFTFVENNVSTWKEECFFAACKNNLLRMCNDLLRRLSRSQNTVFCGRILLFLAKFFPFSERSGLNIVSEFNLENLTEYENEVIDNGDSLVDSETVQNVKIDYNLYCKFWALQDFFRNPNQCYNKMPWKIFAGHASNVLAAFSSFKLDEQEQDIKKNVIPLPGGTSSSSSSAITTPNNSTTTGVKQLSNNSTTMEVDEKWDEINQHFFAKFLTNPKLLALQLSDSNFRRSVLVQFLILFQYLRSTVKFKSDSHNLSSVQSEFIKKTETLVYKLLDETPPSGKNFSKTVQHMLQREELWNTWKNEGCKEFKRPELSADEISKIPLKKPRRHLGDLLRDANKQGKFYMGNVELTKLWNISPDNLQACRGADRNFLPSIESYLENPKDKTDQTFEWRALRLLARQSPHFFTMIQTPNKISDYLEGLRKKIHESRAKTIKLEAANEIKVDTNEKEEKDDNIMDVGAPDTIDADTNEAEQLSPDDKNTHKTVQVTEVQIRELSTIIGVDWKKLGNKFGFRPDELQYFQDENPQINDACYIMLKHWFEEDVDASLENLAYIAEGLEMITVTDAIRRMIEPLDRTEDISD